MNDGMRVFIPSQNGIPERSNFYAAWLGFRQMGFETVPYFAASELDAATREDVVVGGVGSCQCAMKLLGVEPPHVDYPDSLREFLGRRVWASTINGISNDSGSWPVFVKPVRDKGFTGTVVRSAEDLIGCRPGGEDADVVCSEVVDFLTEWRCFVRYGEILDVRPYRGDWRLHFSPGVIESAVGRYANAPAGYGIDFGVTSSGETLLVEVNDGYALGSYGLQQNLYAQLLSARWAEIMGVPDELGYIGRHVL